MQKQNKDKNKNWILKISERMGETLTYNFIIDLERF